MRIAGNMGYVITCIGFGPMYLDGRDGLLYFHREVTVFRDRRKAQRAIEAQLRASPDFTKRFGLLRVLPLKPAHDDPSYRVAVDRRQGVVVNEKL